MKAEQLPAAVEAVEHVIYGKVHSPEKTNRYALESVNAALPGIRQEVERRFWANDELQGSRAMASTWAVVERSLKAAFDG